ncbi:TBCC-domain-containing protein [Artomyces pyxidatus]|uniref:TBCC-domain-containing protein n=1 Tax=Artomyces pyxidatus TaxID=48021 RepID=A0ACB8SRL6_9AGAM|nr:TBCC-domain-containing protein [Artomyces pyxidatus]
MSDASNKAFQADFYAHFQASRAAVTTTLEAQKTNVNPNTIQETSVKVAALRKSLVDATDLLLAYDRRQCEEQMAALESLLEDIRASAAPKPRFAFKRKGNKPPAALPTGPKPLPEANASGATTTRESDTTPSTFHTLAAHSHRYLTSRSIPTYALSSPEHSDLTIADLDHCIVNLCTVSSLDPAQESPPILALTALHVRDLKDTILVLPSIKGSALLHNLTRCIIVVGCHQFRMHTSTDVRVHLSISSNPIIEHCSGIAFAPYPAAIAGLAPALAENLAKKSTHASVQDFSHIRQTPSPNWSLVAGDAAEPDWKAILDEPEGGVDTVLATYLPEVVTPVP